MAASSNLDSLGPAIEADDSDRDSAVEDTASSTASLISEITNYQMENGRRYHGYRAGKYAFPNDEAELDRMDLENHLFNLLFQGKLHFAPLNNPLEILDAACGTGIWTIDVADQYPSARVIGTDLSPVQPREVPPNLEFQVDDIEQEWTFPENHFDLIHWRLLLASVTDLPALLERAFRHIKPGGYLEIHELDPHFYCDDGSAPEDCASIQWGNLFAEACAKMGRPLHELDTYKELLGHVGFTDIEERMFKRPSNSWPKDRHMKEIGKFTCANMLDGYEAFTVGPFTRALGWSKLEIDILLAKSKAEFKSRSIHGYQKVIAIHGRKPMTNPPQEDQNPPQTI